MTPVLNDWESVQQLVAHVDKLESLAGKSVRILIVDDGSHSIDFVPAEDYSGCISEVEVLSLKSNQGHQRAIALGLAEIEKRDDADLVIVMDSDGEDRPEDIGQLIDAHEKAEDSIIVARRARRSEGLAFKLFYQIYKLIFVALTGKNISFGNFSLIPASKLPSVLYNSGVWNNLAATLLKCRVDIVLLSTQRGNRYAGQSKMNFSNLMVHGFSAISVFTDIVIGRIIISLAALFVGVMLLSACVLYIKLFLNVFVPGYATFLLLFMIGILALALFNGLLLILSLLATRSFEAAYPSVALEHLKKTSLVVWPARQQG